MNSYENFRDTKSSRYGFALEQSRTRSCERMSVLLLIAALTRVLAWLAGLLCRERGTAKEYQAQSSKFVGALSLVYLGREVLKRKKSLRRSDFDHALTLLKQLAQQNCVLTCVIT